MELPIIPLKDMLMSGTKEDLVNNARQLHVKISSTLRKEPFAERLADVILKEPLVVLNALSWGELMRLRGWVNNPTPRPYDNRDLKRDSLEMMGIVLFIKDKDNDEMHSFPSYELVERLKNRIDPYIASQDPNSTKFRRRQLLTGLINLYGMIAFTDLEKIARRYDPEFHTYDVMKCIDGSYELQSSVLEDYGSWYVSSYLEPGLDLFYEFSVRQDIPHKIFSLEEVMAAGDSYLPIPPINPATGEFRNMLRIYMGSDEDAQYKLRDVWMMLNNDLRVSDVLSSIIESITFEKRDVQKFMNAFMEYTNHLPHWIMKGNTPREVFEKYEKPKLQPLPKTPFVYPKPASQPDKEGRVVPFPIDPAIAGKPSQPNLPHKKIGRNDPCFCGSGRKYKHCCGN